MEIQTDARVVARAYIHGELPCPVAKAIIRNLLEDLAAAYGEIKHLNREKAELTARLEKP